MFFRDKLSNILRSAASSGGAAPAGGGPGGTGGAPSPYVAGASSAAPAAAGGVVVAQAAAASNSVSLGDGAHNNETIFTYTPNEGELRSYRSANRELETEIDKQRKRKKNALIFLGIGIFCTVLLGAGLFMPYGPQGFTAMESLQGAKGGALGLETAQLAFGFSAVGFAIPIAMTVISLIVGLASNNKINKFKKEKAFYNELMLGLSSSNPEISRNRELQNATAVLSVEDGKVLSWQDRVKKARITNTNSNTHRRT